MKIVFSLFLIFQVTFENDDFPIVNIPSLGKIQGTIKTSYKEQNFYSFEGVPYAQPPVGEYRFKEPHPISPWQGILQAKTVYKCMQYYHYTPPGVDYVIGDEDCLYLNIYTPNFDQNANLDVVIFIHGGAFMFNYGALFGPEYIIDKNIVYINLNYRLGPLGFLSTENNVVPGNNGLKDQICALQWIKENIKFFGGNPNSVTIFGMSAGGASIHFHFLSPKSRGLFHKGISQSGTMFNAWTLQENALGKAKILSASLGCSTEDINKMIECLNNRSARQIVGAVQVFQPWLYNPFSPFAPVVDSWSNDPVLPEHPYMLIKKKQVADIPWIASYTSGEGLYPGSDFYKEEKYLQDIDTRWNEIVPFILHYNYTVKPELRDAVSQKIRQYYLGKKTVNRDTFLDLIKILTDRLFAVDIEKTVLLQASVMKSPIYFYYFTYRGAHSKSEARSGTSKDFGASHADDTLYIFRTPIDTASTETDRRMMEFMTELIVSFAKHGKPNVPIEWSPVSKNQDVLTYLKIASPDNLSMENSILDSQEFWKSLPLQENEKLFEEKKDEL